MTLKSAILMTTYNGEKFIEEQLKSIKHQTETNWRLYIRDDGSTDGTLAIIKKIAETDTRIVLLKDNNGNIGVKEGFLYLLRNVKAQYYFFSDQDDVWLPEKMGKTIKKFELHSKTDPVLVHTNLTTVDENLNVLKLSFHPMSKKLDKLNVVLASNSVTGCTVAINNALKEKVKDDSSKLMIMHDWWLAICAASFGHIEYVYQPMISYRQHSANQVGTDRGIKDKLKKLLLYDYEIKKNNLSFKQAKNMLNRHSLEMTPYTRKMVNEYAVLLEKNRWKRIVTLVRYSFKKRSFIGTLSLWISVVSQKKLHISN